MLFARLRAMPTSEAIARATGKDLEQWRDYIETTTAKSVEDLDHKAIAENAVKGGASPWWAQAVAVELEKMIGRRVTGQTCTSTFAANASKTVAGEWTELAKKFEDWVASNPDAVPGVIVGETRLSESDKWRYWRATLDDGSIAALDICAGTSAGKAKIAMNHDKLADEESMLAAKAQWKETLNHFASYLTEK